MLRSEPASGLLHLSLVLLVVLPSAGETADFQREIRPILSGACFHCHGPDEKTRMAGLRLDTRDGVFAARKSGVPVVAGKPEDSLVYQRIVHKNANLRMPPAYSHKTLNERQVGALKRWIEQGAPWKEHWSFTAPVKPALPAVGRKEWPRNGIDAFILAKLESAGLAPASEAGRRDLIRRLSLDLTGLPPTPAEVDAFERDQSRDAYEKLVDRLLASPHYGEHRARYWLDAARYADTHGLHIDNYREMWAWRDWVIGAFNRNLPFDRFTIEQLAGDLLPDRTMEQQIASGFHRCNVTTNEAGVIIEEVEAMYAKDRVETTATVWLGLTAGCASCHDHKFDPISTRDFYSLAAFFRNTSQNAMDGNIADTPPVIVVPRPPDRRRWRELASEEPVLRARMAELRAVSSAAFAGWLAAGEYRNIQAPLEAAGELLSLSWTGGPKFHFGGAATPISLPDGVKLGPSTTEGNALHFEQNAAVPLANVEHFDGDKPFSIATWFFFPAGEDAYTVASQSDPAGKNRGWSIDVAARVALLRLVGDDGKSLQIRAGHLEQLRPGTWNHLVFTYDGSRHQTGLGMYLNGMAISTQGSGEANLDLKGSLRTSAPLLLGNQGKRFLAGGAISDFRIWDRVVSEEEARLAHAWPLLAAARTKPGDRLSPVERDALELYYLNHRDAEYRRLAGLLKRLREERLAIRRSGAVTHVMDEREDTQPFAHILYRGMYDQPRDRVEPNVPAALPLMPASFPRNRLGLARWLVDPANPLTARVTVNRFWQEIFGAGLVKTSEDFGSQGEPPSHPELLDWLASEFRESGWDVKKLLRMLVAYSAYRQAAFTTPEKLQKDPDNRLLSRGPRFRMDAEMVRDYVLAASGLLARTIGGPSVKPYQPGGVWEAVAMLSSNTRHYTRDGGGSLYRRSLYTFWKRSAPPASMEIFNAPSRENCSVRRERTNTPLQALVTMNDTQFVEAARLLAQAALVQAPGAPDAQAGYMAERLLSRRLQENERDVVRRAYLDYLSYYISNPPEAKKLLAVGEAKADETLPPAELAALTMVANQMMNLDEVLNK